jgi:hypothetical protein
MGFTHLKIELNPWLGAYHTQIPVLSALCRQLNLLNPTPKQNSWVRHCLLWPKKHSCGNVLTFEFGKVSQYLFQIFLLAFLFVIIGCPKPLVRNYHDSLHNNPDEHSSHLLCNRSLKSHISLMVYTFSYCRADCISSVISFFFLGFKPYLLLTLYCDSFFQHSYHHLVMDLLYITHRRKIQKGTLVILLQRHTLQAICNRWEFFMLQIIIF